MKQLTVYFVHVGQRNYVTLNPIEGSKILFKKCITEIYNYEESKSFNERLDNKLTFLKKPIKRMDHNSIISIRLQNVLRASGIKTLYQVLVIGPELALNFDMIGKKSMKELDDLFKKHDLFWTYHDETE